MKGQVGEERGIGGGGVLWEGRVVGVESAGGDGDERERVCGASGEGPP